MACRHAHPIALIPPSCASCIITDAENKQRLEEFRWSTTHADICLRFSFLYHTLRLRDGSCSFSYFTEGETVDLCSLHAWNCFLCMSLLPSAGASVLLRLGQRLAVWLVILGGACPMAPCQRRLVRVYVAYIYIYIYIYYVFTLTLYR
jgi:hypothetical protein